MHDVLNNIVISRRSKLTEDEANRCLESALALLSPAPLFTSKKLLPTQTTLVFSDTLPRITHQSQPNEDNPRPASGSKLKR